ncbi:unnamed protein product [Thlaspi arvense]|uniref:FBD domain-containing protein n=1 Tax=Thlaspi arvense TaxID=13288 RepID=A0AAU9RMU4_THLAR|nr:unnamed protein product [Thlaspi arvense]CAH2046398.1 unnamed protein product [Thlaspi arvense]
MEKIISGCPALEDLTLIRSRHYRHREVPKILTVRSKSLRRFRILFNVAYGMAGTDYSVVIDAPRLEYLSLSDNQSDVILVNNLTSLFMIDIDTKFNVEFGGIQLSPAQKDNIRDFLTSVSGLFYPYRYLWPKFGNLYRLEIAFPSYALHYLPAFLESCPNLRELIVDFSFTVPKDRLRYVPKCLLSTLECVEINNLIMWEETGIELMNYFLENSAVLKKLSVSFTDSSITNQERHTYMDRFASTRRSRECQVFAY